MLPIHPQYITNDDDERTAVVLSLAEWNRILEELEELDDIRAYDAAKRGSSDTVPFDTAVREIRDAYRS